MSSIVANTHRFKHNPAVSVVGRPSWERVYVSAFLRRWHSIHTPHLLTTIPCSILQYQHCHNGNPFLRHWLTCELVICICVEIFKPSVSITQAYKRFSLGPGPDHQVALQSECRIQGWLVGRLLTLNCSSLSPHGASLIKLHKKLKLFEFKEVFWFCAFNIFKWCHITP